MIIQINFVTVDKDKKFTRCFILKKTLSGPFLTTKRIQDTFKVGDILFVKKENNLWNLKQYPKVNGGIVVLDPFSGDVKALVGLSILKSGEFNRVTQAKRQPGSAFKPIVYAAALENGFSPKYNNIRCPVC